MARGAQPPDRPSDGNGQSTGRSRQIFAERSESAIGADLRAAREGLGLDLRQIASVLNIRYTYLEAIEEGRFDDLPGATYALGFVRGYAVQLGLDPVTVIERFKDEAAGIYRTTRLSFPEPVAEARIPGGAILLVSAFLAIVAYGGWYFYSANDIDIADLVPKVPERLMSLIAGDDAKQGEEPKVADMSATPPSEALASKTPAAAAVGTPVVAETPTSQTATPKSEPPKSEPPKPAPPKPVETAAAKTPAPVKPPVIIAAPDPVPSPAPSPVTITAVPDPVPSPVASPVTIIAAPDPVPSPPTVTVPPAPTPEVAALPAVPEVPRDAAAPPPDARAYGAGNTASRITVRAKSDSWIQVREANNTLLITRILRAGDSYRVPNLKGLRLMTGNAGALDILVDGKVVAPIGLFGVVRRRVLLDPERLVAGTAVAE